MQSPTVGRIVRYGAGAGVVLPAIVTHVWSETCVNLFVFPDGIYPHLISGVRTSVQQAGENDFAEDVAQALSTVGRWWWPNQQAKPAMPGVPYPAAQ